MRCIARLVHLEGLKEEESIYIQRRCINLIALLDDIQWVLKAGCVSCLFTEDRKGRKGYQVGVGRS